MSRKDISIEKQGKIPYKLNLDDKRSPRGITLEEYMQTPAYIESFPSPISCCYSTPKNSTKKAVYSNIVKFVNSHFQYPAFKQLLFPLFCKIILLFRAEKDEDSITAFSKEFLNTLTSTEQNDIQEFIRDPDYCQLAKKFSAMLYKVEVTDEEQIIFNQFLNQKGNSQIKNLVMSTIILKCKRIENHEIVTKPLLTEYEQMTYQKSNNFPPISILHGNIITASHAVISPRPFIFASLNQRDIVRIDADSQKSVYLYSHPATVTSLSLSHHGSALATTDSLGNIRISAQPSDYTDHLRSNFPPFESHSFSPKLPVTNLQFESDVPIWCSQFSPYGGALAVGDNNGLVRIISMEKMKMKDSSQFRVLPETNLTNSQILNPVTYLKWHPNCSLIASLHSPSYPRESFVIPLWDLRDPCIVRLFTTKERPCLASFSPDGAYLAIADGNFTASSPKGTIKVFDIGVGECNWFIEKDSCIGGIKGLEFTNDSNSLIIVEKSGKISCWNWRNQNVTVDITNINSRVIGVDMNVDNILKIMTSKSH